MRVNIWQFFISAATPDNSPLFIFWEFNNPFLGLGGRQGLQITLDLKDWMKDQIVANDYSLNEWTMGINLAILNGYHNNAVAMELGW